MMQKVQVALVENFGSMMRVRFFQVTLIGLFVLAAGIATTAGQGDESDRIQEVVQNFYADYLAQLQADLAHGTGSPLIEGAYRSSPYLTPGWIANVDNVLATIANGSTLIDPFILAQDVPERVEVEVTEIWSEGAETLVREYFPGNPYSHNITVLLNNRDGWKIDYVVDGENVTPAGVVEAYYTWYLKYVQPDEQGNFHNPLTDLAYVYSPYLSARLVSDVNALVESMVSGGADPFLMAEDFPQTFTVEPISTADMTATVILREWFVDNPISHDVLITLTRGADFWQIDRISDTIAPDVVASLFYNGYVTYRRYDIEQGITRVPFVDWGSGLESYLDDELHDRWVRMFSRDEGVRGDPVLCAQDIPEHIETAPLDETPRDAVVAVNAVYLAEGGITIIHAMAVVKLNLEDGRWQIANVTCSQ